MEEEKKVEQKELSRKEQRHWRMQNILTEKLP